MGLYLPELPPGWGVITADWQGRLSQDRTLPVAVAAMLLEHPERWLLEHADGHVSLFQTHLGGTRSVQQWLALASDAAVGLPLG
jgi:hypothetical protein